MKVALISDTHFGDPKSVLIQQQGGKYIRGPKYEALKNAVGKDNNYLILLGDIFDFAIQSYAEAYNVGKVFFEQIQIDDLAEQMIYVPGNHDADIWHTVEHEVNIIYQINKGKIPEQFRMSLPGFIDDREESRKKRLVLPGVTERRIAGKLGYGGLFLDNLTTIRGKKTRFNFAYPNLYFATDNELVLITHGHYFEPYWSLVSEWAPIMLGKDLEVNDPMLLKEMATINFPLNQLACSGVGQAGPLTKAAYQIEQDVKKGDTSNLKIYLDKLQDEILKREFDYWPIDPRRFIPSGVMSKVKSMLLEGLSKVEGAQYNETFMEKEAVRNRFKVFYERSCIEIDHLNQTYEYAIAYPSKVIFGHTHQPIPWESNKAPEIEHPNRQKVRLFNSGGWLTKKQEDGREEFCGAEVFKYETGKGFSSISIQ